MALEEGEQVIKSSTGVGTKGMAAIMGIKEEVLVDHADEVNQVIANHAEVKADAADTADLLQTLRAAGRAATENGETTEEIGSLG